VLLDFSRVHSLYDAPFPSDDLQAGGGPADVSGFPNPNSVALLEQARTLLAENDGFSASGGVFFQVSEAIDPADLPSVTTSSAADSTAFLIGIDDASPDYGVRYPLEVTFEPKGSQYGAPNLIALLPIQGTPLRRATRYAAVVTTAIHSAKGEALTRAPDAALARFPDAVAALAAAGVGKDHIAGITAYTTGDPTAVLATVRAAALARPLPAIDAPFAQTDQFTDFCAYHTTIDMPDWQSGTPPFSSDGGTWQFDSSGAPIFQRSETANLVVTVPRSPMPSAGYPLIVFVRTGGGGDRPLVDRGQQATEGGPPIEAGEGPARYFARAGFAAIEVDGPLGGLRNTTGADEQFLTFNVGNLGAMRDNIRESAVELDVIAHVGVALHFDASACPGSGGASVTFDASHVGIMGHSMGSWIEPLAIAAEPMFRVVLMSGAGGSWIENIMYKQKPTPVLLPVSTFLQDGDLRADDPVMTFAQWALEPADPQLYGTLALREPAAGISPRHVLMMQGIVDDYILPRIANSTSLSFGLDLAGTELDTESDPRLAGELAVGPLLPLVPLDARATIGLPASGNAGGVTAVLTQHPEDGIEDGHEVVFQTDVPKHEYQCFLASWLATGTPWVPTDATRDAPCP
jgi:hypothetical protein